MMPYVEIRCPVCEKDFIRPSKHVAQVRRKSGVWKCKPCSTSQRNQARAKPIGATRIHRQTGYVQEKTAAGWVRQHILVMERHLGRRLNPGEMVHHVNEVKTDNTISNLRLMTVGEHTVLHHQGKARTEEQRARIRNAVRKSRNVRLDVEKAAFIRRAIQSENVTQRDLARKLGVSPMTINRVVNNHTWI